MKMYDTLNELLGSFPTGPPDALTFEIQSTFIKAWGKIHGVKDKNGSAKDKNGGHSLYPRVMVSISGGADNGKKNIM